MKIFFENANEKFVQIYKKATNIKQRQIINKSEIKSSNLFKKLIDNNISYNEVNERRMNTTIANIPESTPNSGITEIEKRNPNDSDMNLSYETQFQNNTCNNIYVKSTISRTINKKNVSNISQSKVVKTKELKDSISSLYIKENFSPSNLN